MTRLQRGAAAGLGALVAGIGLACGGVGMGVSEPTPADHAALLDPHELAARSALPLPVDADRVHCSRTQIFANLNVRCSYGGPATTWRFTYEIARYPFASDAERGIASRLHEREVVMGHQGYAPVEVSGVLSWGEDQQCRIWEHADGFRVGPYCAARQGNRTITFDLEGVHIAGAGSLDLILAPQTAAMSTWDPAGT